MFLHNLKGEKPLRRRMSIIKDFRPSIPLVSLSLVKYWAGKQRDAGVVSCLQRWRELKSLLSQRDGQGCQLVSTGKMIYSREVRGDKKKFKKKLTFLTQRRVLSAFSKRLLIRPLWEVCTSHSFHVSARGICMTVVLWQGCTDSYWLQIALWLFLWLG